MDIENKLKKLIAEQLSIPEDEVTPEARFEEDLGCDSFDLVELIIAIEEEFDVEIPDDEADQIKTVQEVKWALIKKNK